MKYIKIEGIIESETLPTEFLMDQLLHFLEINGCTFGGGWSEVDENGEPLKPYNSK